MRTTTRARRLPAIAAWINANLADKGYVAKIEQGYSSTDRDIPGTRLVHPGKGRYGNRLVVTRYRHEVKTHNSAETYRTNDEVENWLTDELEMLAQNDDARQWDVRWYDNKGSRANYRTSARVRAATYEAALETAKLQSISYFGNVEAVEVQPATIRRGW